MTIRNTILTSAAIVLLAAALTPAAAVSIRHTNRAEGDPDAPTASATRTAPPADASGQRYFDKAHENDPRR